MKILTWSMLTIEMQVGLVHPEKNPHERWITWVKTDRERSVQFVDASPCLNTMPANGITVLP